MQKLARGLLERNSGVRTEEETFFERALQRDVFRLRSFSTFRETASERIIQFLSAAMTPSVNQSCRVMTSLDPNDVIPGFLERQTENKYLS